MGLDNSGKTSIILSLKKDTNLLTYYSLNPTQGLNIVNIEENGMKYSIWDFGGQEQYRQDYLQNFEKHIQGVDRVIYVIDVQDSDRYETALQYLEAIVKGFKDKIKGCDFAIYLHKFDPQLEMRSEFSRKVDDHLTKKLKKIMPSSCNYKIYRTSIYTIFKKNLVD